MSGVSPVWHQWTKRQWALKTGAISLMAAVCLCGPAFAGSVKQICSTLLQTSTAQVCAQMNAAYARNFKMFTCLNILALKRQDKCMLCSRIKCTEDLSWDGNWKKARSSLNQLHMRVISWRTRSHNKVYMQKYGCCSWILIKNVFAKGAPVSASPVLSLQRSI